MKKFSIILGIFLFALYLLMPKLTNAKPVAYPGRLDTYGEYLACVCPDMKKDCVCVLIDN